MAHQGGHDQGEEDQLVGRRLGKGRTIKPLQAVASGKTSSSGGGSSQVKKNLHPAMREPERSCDTDVLM